MHILIADKLSHGTLHDLERSGHQVDFEPGLKADQLPEALAARDPEVLVVRSTKVTEAALTASGRLGLVVRAGAGVNTIDLEAAGRRGIFVANCPGKNAVAVAELTLGLMLALDRGIADASRTLHEGTWCKKRFSRARGLKGQRLGLVGFGATAQEVALRAAALGMRVGAWTPRLHPDRAAALGVEAFPTLDALLSQSDVVSVHCPNRPETRGLIADRELNLMRDGSTLIHTARGGIVDDEALAGHLRAGRLRAGLDVFVGEPGSGDEIFESPVRGAAGAVLTPHIGASTQQALEETGAEVVRIISDFATLGEVHNVVNVAASTVGHHRLVVRHEDRVGVLASVLETLRSAEHNVKEMQNVIFDAGAGAASAASATITVEQLPSDVTLDRLRGLEAVLAVEVRSSSKL